jgi:hypothetical protein
MEVCKEEYDLYQEFFVLEKDSLKYTKFNDRSYLLSLADNLSYILRPKIMKEFRIESLSEICHSLLYIIGGESHNYFEIKYVIENILHDAQSRLINRGEYIIQNEIANFNPRDQELLVLARGPASKYYLI